MIPQDRYTTGAHMQPEMLREPIPRINCTDKKQTCFSVHFIIFHKSGFCLFCFSDYVKLVWSRWVMSHCQDFCMRPMCVFCVEDDRFSFMRWFSPMCMYVCVANYCKDVWTNLSLLFGCRAAQLSYVQILVCVCVCMRKVSVCVCCGVQMSWNWCPASNKGFCGAKWRGGQPGDWQGREAWVKSCVIMSLCGFWTVNGIDPMLYPYSEVPNSTCLYSLSHRVCVCILLTWFWMMSCAAAAWLTDSFRTTTWGPMVRLSGW